MRRFCVGFFDWLFGETIEIELPNANGDIIKQKVTKRWFEKMKKEGLVNEIKGPIVRVHVLDPLADNVITEHWIIGKDIAADVVTRFKDTSTGDIFAMIFYRNGQPQCFVLRKLLWQEARRAMDEAMSEEQLRDLLLALIERNETG